MLAPSVGDSPNLGAHELAGRIEAGGDDRFGAVEQQWRERIAAQAPDATGALMNAVNPMFIARNHRVEEAIAAAVDGDLSVFHDLNRVLANPFAEQPEFAHYAQPPKPDERVTQTFCGT